MSDFGQYDALEDSVRQSREHRRKVLDSPEGRRLQREIRKARQSIWDEDYDPSVLDTLKAELLKLLD